MLSFTQIGGIPSDRLVVVNPSSPEDPIPLNNKSSLPLGIGQAGIIVDSTQAVATIVLAGGSITVESPRDKIPRIFRPIKEGLSPYTVTQMDKSRLDVMTLLHQDIGNLIEGLGLYEIFKDDLGFNFYLLVLMLFSEYRRSGLIQEKQVQLNYLLDLLEKNYGYNVSWISDRLNK